MESNGYPARAELPTYRIMRGVVSKANFAGPFGQVSNYLIPKTVIPDEELQTLIATMTIRDGVATYVCWHSPWRSRRPTSNLWNARVRRLQNDQDRVATIYHTVILGGSPTLMQGGAVQQNITIAPGDLVGLIFKLKDLGVPVEGITELTQAIDADKSSGETFGQQTAGWLAGASRKVASSAWKLAIAAAPDVLAAMVKGYLGLH